VVTCELLKLLAWSEIQKGLLVEKDNPHGFCRFPSVICAVLGRFETRFD
jgi:hypothetical protein